MDSNERPRRGAHAADEATLTVAVTYDVVAEAEKIIRRGNCRLFEGEWCSICPPRGGGR